MVVNLLYISMSKERSKESKESTTNNSNKARSLELSTNVNDYDTGEPLDCNNNIAETRGKKKIDGYNKSVVVKTGEKFTS
jgi:hypothetical protein